MNPISRFALALTALVAITPALAYEGYPEPDCPEGTRLKRVCMSTPRAGDNVIAASALDGIGVCAGKDATHLALITEGGYETFEAQVDKLAGGIRYRLPEEQGSNLSLTVTGFKPGKKRARIHMNLEEDGTVISSTYTCNR